MTFSPDQIPAELRRLDQWVAWRFEWQNDRLTKVPYTADRTRKASCSDRSTWAPFLSAAATAMSGEADGVGLQVASGGGYTAIDVDHCRDSETGVIQDWARDIIGRLNSYTEISPSGTGLHVWIRGSKPGSRSRNGKVPGVEVYDSDHYLTTSGDHLDGTPTTILDRQTELGELYQRLFPEPPHQNGVTRPTPDGAPADLGIRSAEVVIELALKHKSAAKWAKLLRGDISGYGPPGSEDDSRADLALVSLICFYSRDPAVVDEIVRGSGLAREKWNRPDYQTRTFDKAMSGRTQFYTPWPTLAAVAASGAAQDGGAVSATSPPTTAAASGEQELRLAFRTAHQRNVETPARVDWIVGNLAAAGCVTELTGPQKLSGKTTFLAHAVAARLDGRRFLGQPSVAGPAVWLSEESWSTLQEPLREAQLLDRDDLHLLCREDAFGVGWPEVARQARALAVGLGAQLLIADTLSSLAGLKGEEENASGAAMEAIRPVQEVAAANIAVVLSRHDRRAGGEPGESGRGSTAFSGASDLVFRLTRLGGDGRGTLRQLAYVGRLRGVPEKLVVELTPGGYVVVGTAADVRRREAREALLEHLPDTEEEATTLPSLWAQADAAKGRRAGPLAASPIGKTTFRQAADELLAAGLVARRDQNSRRQLWWCVSGPPGSAGHTENVSGGGQGAGCVSGPLTPIGSGHGHTPDTYAVPPDFNPDGSGPERRADTSPTSVAEVASAATPRSVATALAVFPGSRLVGPTGLRQEPDPAAVGRNGHGPHDPDLELSPVVAEPAKGRRPTRSGRRRRGRA